MPKKKSVSTGTKEIVYDPGKANPKQLLFLESEYRFTCYGGAKAGGKTWVLRKKACLGAMLNDGIKILIIRAHYPELEMNHIRPICAEIIPLGIAAYNGTTHIMSFNNGSIIKFGHWSGEESENEYQGQEYDWIFIDEATQFSERAFNYLAGCLRGTNPFPKRMYLTCNPGGVGHWWVKRLFIDKKYKTNSDNPEENEDPNDYTFIFARAEDNIAMIENSPGYLKSLAKMPNAAAFRYGDWDSLGGNYFKEFSEHTHCVKPFNIPKSWTLYRSFDYGLDMFACFWWAVDEDGRCWCIRSFEQSDLNIQDAAQAAIDNTLPGENIPITYAPPDMWSRQRETGRTTAEIFALSGLPLTKSDNNRVQGHLIMRYMMSPIPLKDRYVRSLYKEPPDTLPGLMFFNTVGGVIEDIKSIQASEKNPNDCSTDPHEITHTVDGCRYFCISRTLPAEVPKVTGNDYEYEDAVNYDEFMTGGEATDSYINY